MGDVDEVESVDDDDAIEPVLEEDEPFEAAEPEYRRKPGRKPGTRQSPALKEAIDSGRRSWWETVVQGEMTKTAVEEEKRMRDSKAARQVSSVRFSFS